MATMELDEPGEYGRVIRDTDGSVLRVAEAKDGRRRHPGGARDPRGQRRRLRVRGRSPQGRARGPSTPDNAQGELYLPDVLPAIRAAGHTVAAHPIGDPDLTHGVDDRVDLAYAHEVAQRRILRGAHARRGHDRRPRLHAHRRRRRRSAATPRSSRSPSSRAARRSARDSVVGAFTTLIDTHVGDGVTILQSHLNQARVDDGAIVGPFSYLRPGAHLHERAKAGTFVEIKNSEIGAGTKVPHLSYIGDADVGEGTNIGAGNITANYDGTQQAPDDDRRERQDERRHRLRRARDGRRQRLHRRRQRDHRATCRPARSESPAPGRRTSRATRTASSGERARRRPPPVVKSVTP